MNNSSKNSNPGYLIELTENICRCSDGCCVDGGYKVSIYERDIHGNSLVNLFEDNDWETKPYSEDALRVAFKELKNILGREAIEDVDYYITRWVDDCGDLRQDH